MPGLHSGQFAAGTAGPDPVVGAAPVGDPIGVGMDEQPEPEVLLTPAEVAAMFRVNPKTVTRWARAGKISAIRTLGGHRRFRASEVRRFLEQVETGEPAAEA